MTTPIVPAASGTGDPARLHQPAQTEAGTADAAEAQGHDPADTEAPQCTVYYDGACPVCAAEIGHYRSLEGARQLAWVDVSAVPAEALPAGLTRARALARFHVADAGGGLRDGAAAFVLMWRQLPRWRWLARLARLPGALTVMEAGYRLFLTLRPLWRRPAR